MDLAPMQFCVPFTQIKRKKNRNTTQKILYPTLENFMKEEFRCRGAKKKSCIVLQRTYIASKSSTRKPSGKISNLASNISMANRGCNV